MPWLLTNETSANDDSETKRYRNTEISSQGVRYLELQTVLDAGRRWGDKTKGRTLRSESDPIVLLQNTCVLYTV